MNLTDILHRTQKILRDNSPAILTALGVSGTLSTAYLAAKASVKADRVIRLHEAEVGYPADPRKRVKERVQAVWKMYIPTAVSGTVTIACIIGAAKAGSKKSAAAYSLLSVSEHAFTEYKEKVVEQIGEKKEQALRDEIAQARVSKTAPTSEIVLVGSGPVLCHEMHTGRYFNSDIETIRKAVNEVNAKMVRETEATLSDFYYIIGLPTTSYSDSSGWDNCRLLELSWSATIAPGDRPCMAFEYNYIEPF